MRIKRTTDNEIINTLIEHLGGVFGGVRSPSKFIIKSTLWNVSIPSFFNSELKELREVASTLTHTYPAMYLSTGNGSQGMPMNSITSCF